MSKVAEPAFASHGTRYYWWNQFVRTRPNSIYSYQACRGAAIRDDPDGVVQWNEWLYFVADRKVRGLI
jgi:hypothetical protein